jgi:hypothetical protein
MKIIQNLLISAIIRFSKPKKLNDLSKFEVDVLRWDRMNSIFFPVILYEVGNLQVYHFQTIEDKEYKRPYKEVFWRDKETTAAYGPFSTIHEATHHYISIQQLKKDNKAKKKIVLVDFKNRKKLGYFS